MADKAANDTKGQEFAVLRAAAEDYKGGRWENLKASSKWGLHQALDYFNPAVVISLLDRIEELERHLELDHDCKGEIIEQRRK